MKDLTVSLEDRPGTLADLGEALGKAGINIEGLTVVSFEGRAIGHVLVEDATAARSALEGAGVNIQVVYLATKNRAVAITSDNAKARQALGL